MNLSHLVTSYQPDTSRPSSTSSSQDNIPGLHYRFTATQTEARPQSMSSSYFDRNASNLAYTKAPQPPLSPPGEEPVKCSLPSISNLLQGVDNLANDHVASMNPF